MLSSGQAVFISVHAMKYMQFSKINFGFPLFVVTNSMADFVMLMFSVFLIHRVHGQRNISCGQGIYLGSFCDKPARFVLN